MPHKTPEFWYPKGSEASLPFYAKLLRPASWFYATGFKIHQGLSNAQKADIPVICVGNLTAGGSGKTPTCIALLNALKEENRTKNPFFILRGYGGSERGPLLVDPKVHNTWDVGDEALVLSRYAPTIIAADRFEATKLAAEKGADIVILDDGLQNPGLHKDFNLIVINGEMGFGNQQVLPAGPLREPLEHGLGKADAFLIIGEDHKNVCSLLPKDIPIFEANLQPDKDTLPDLSKPYLAFAGLGYPEKFFNFLYETLGYKVVKTVPYPDHYPYKRADIQALRKQANTLDAEMLTTEKDYFRLPKGFKDDVSVVHVSMVLDHSQDLTALISECIQNVRKERAV